MTLLFLVSRQAVNSIGLRGLQLDLVVHYLAKAYLLIDNVDKQQGDDGNDQERRPPTGVPAKVGKGSGRRKKSADEALSFRQRCWFLRRLC
jgi:hypothetical protein